MWCWSWMTQVVMVMLAWLNKLKKRVGLERGRVMRHLTRRNSSPPFIVGSIWQEKAMCCRPKEPSILLPPWRIFPIRVWSIGGPLIFMCYPTPKPRIKMWAHETPHRKPVTTIRNKKKKKMLNFAIGCFNFTCNFDWI